MKKIVLTASRKKPAVLKMQDNGTYTCKVSEQDFKEFYGTHLLWRRTTDKKEREGIACRGYDENSVHRYSFFKVDGEDFIRVTILPCKPR